MAIPYAPLFALETQFQTKDGRNNTGGFLKVFLAATDDPATTYSDYNGTRNPEKIVLDDDGRALVICDKSKAYRLEVYDINGTLLWTEEPVYCSGTGGGGVSITKVISTDGSISIDENVAGSTTTYDIGLAPNDSDEFLEWIKCSENECGATWYPVFQDGSMETDAGKGIKVHGGHLYHFTNSFTVDPDGTGINYDTFRVAMYCGDDIVDERDFDIDSSLNDPVLCEFSRDVVQPEDTHVYFKLTIPSTCKVSGEVQCHRIYSGINAVPDTCATKQWVSASYQPLSGMSSWVPYSAVGNNGMGQVTGINGSAIAGGLDSASVSSIASSVASAYTESAFSSLSSKADSSALSAYQPVSAMGSYATTAYVDGRVSGKLDTTAFNSGDFYPTSNPSGFITGVDLTPYQEKSAMTAYQPSGNYYSASNPSGFITGVDLSDYATTGFVESAVSGKLDTTSFNPGDFYTTANESGFVGRAYVDSAVSGKLDTSAFASASAGFQPTGDYAYNSALTAYIPTSASGAFQPSGDYAFNSAVSSKLDASASGDFVANSAMTSWIPYSALGYSGTAISGIGGSSLAGIGGGGGTGYYVPKSAVEVAIGTGVTALDTAFAQGKTCSASSISFAQGSGNTAALNSLAQGYGNRAVSEGFAQGGGNVAGTYSFAQGNGNKAACGSFAQGVGNTAGGDLYPVAQGYSFAQGKGNSAAYTAAVFGTFNLHGNGDTASGDSAAFAIGDGTAHSARHDLMLVTKNGEITMYSSTADTVGLGLVSSIKAISAAATGGVDSATVSAIASAYTTGKQDTLAFAYNTANQISSINGSALGGMDEAAVSGIASAYAQSAASSKLDTTAQVVTATGSASAEEYDSWPLKTSYLVSSINGSALLPYGYSVLSGNSGRWNSVYNTVSSNSASWSVVSPSGTILVTNGNKIEGTNSAVYTATAGSGEGFTSLLTPNTGTIGALMELLTTGTVPGTGATLSIPMREPLWAEKTYVILSGRDSDNNYASASGIVNRNEQTARIPMGGITGEISASSDQWFNLSNGSMLTAQKDGVVVTTGVAELAWKSAVDNVTNTVATKLDTSAFNSADFYSTANPSGFITGVDLSPYQPTSAMSSYIPTSLSSDFQQVTGMTSYALSSDVSSTVDLVSTQSANWGGSALQLSAGPGVKLEKSGNVLVASTDETVLWSSSGYSVGDTMQTYNLSGNPSDFEEIQVYGQRPLGSTDTMGAFEFRFHPAYLTANSVSKICVPFAFVAGGSVTPYIGGYSVIDINTTSWHDGITWQYQPTTTYQGTAYVAHIHKIVGINRTAEA